MLQSKKNEKKSKAIYMLIYNTILDSSSKAEKVNNIMGVKKKIVVVVLVSIVLSSLISSASAVPKGDKT